MEITELLYLMQNNGYPDLTMEQLEVELIDLEKQGMVDLEREGE